MAATVNETTAFKIKELDPNRSMLWEKPHSTWAWKLEPLAGGRTRLITRLKDRYSWQAAPANALLSLILFEFGDFPMMRKLLLGVKRRAERNAERCAQPAARTTPAATLSSPAPALTTEPRDSSRFSP